MTMDLFKAAIAECQRRANRTMNVAIAVNCIWVVHLVVGNWGVKGPLHLSPLVKVEVFVGIAVFLVAGWIRARTIINDPRLRCPHCHRILFPIRGAVIATKKCPTCGGRVLDE